MLTSSEQEMRERLQKEEQKRLDNMTTKDRIKWAEEHNIRPPGEGKIAKTVDDPEADFRLKCGDKRNFSVMASKRAEQRVAQELLDGTEVDLRQTDELHYIRALVWDNEADKPACGACSYTMRPRCPTRTCSKLCARTASRYI